MHGKARSSFTQIAIQECLNARIHGTHAAAEQPVFLKVVAQQRAGNF